MLIPPRVIVEPSASDSDWILAKFAKLAEEGNGIPVTLLVGGFLVCGTTTSGRDYLLGLGEYLKGAFDRAGRAEAGIELDASLQSAASRYSRYASADESDGSPDEPAYIHLSDVRFMDASGRYVPKNKGPLLWRGRITSIAGFHLGVFDT